MLSKFILLTLNIIPNILSSPFYIKFISFNSDRINLIYDCKEEQFRIKIYCNNYIIWKHFSDNFYDLNNNEQNIEITKGKIITNEKGERSIDGSSLRIYKIPDYHRWVDPGCQDGNIFKIQLLIKVLEKHPKVLQSSDVFFGESNYTQYRLSFLYKDEDDNIRRYVSNFFPFKTKPYVDRREKTCVII